MSRPPAAVLMVLVFVILYVAATVTLAGLLPSQWLLQAVYFLIAGVAWVLPVRWLMLWSVHKR
jgi:hypothetical protein